MAKVLLHNFSALIYSNVHFQTEVSLQKEKDSKAKVEKEKRKVEGELKVSSQVVF